ncbi:MAG TPA: hypothetical protein VFH31_13545 [Pyrinomonadaceae bacterium]|nr:hypothetical protein [Pyrinomonadaceae bacterium]
MSRLDYAPKLKEIQVTDFQKGLGSFTPKPDKPVSFAALRATLKRAGYTLTSADITLSGTLVKDEKGWAIVVSSSKQRFPLQGPNVGQALAGRNDGENIEITGDWKTVGIGKTVLEVITPTEPQGGSNRGRSAYTENSLFAEVKFSQTSLAERYSSVSPVAISSPLAPTRVSPPLAPIRVTSPGLTVYKGGAVVPRFYLIKQHLGDLEVDRQVVILSVSYTPSPRLQLELEAPFSRTTYDDGVTSGSGIGIGNVTAWAKYRFFRKVKTYGDRQAALRVGLELPTGKKTAPSQLQINVPEFVRQQLTPINGGLSPHLDLAFSQAGGRIIFGGNAEVIFRSERDGFRMGHEQRISTDLEYVIPRDPHQPGGELFLILETTFVHRATGRLHGNVVPGSKSSEYYVAPGLQYAAHPQFVVEAVFNYRLFATLVH